MFFLYATDAEALPTSTPTDWIEVSRGSTPPLPYIQENTERDLTECRFPVTELPFTSKSIPKFQTDTILDPEEKARIESYIAKILQEQEEQEKRIRQHIADASLPLPERIERKKQQWKKKIEALLPQITDNESTLQRLQEAIESFNPTTALLFVEEGRKLSRSIAQACEIILKKP